MPIFACIPIIFFYGSLYFKAKPTKRPIGALLSIFAVVILFWAVFKLNGSALNTWADRYTDRQATGTTEKVFSTLVQSKEITYEQASTGIV
jgi:POT family proton-dependent oligopeptide transporter